MPSAYPVHAVFYGLAAVYVASLFLSNRLSHPSSAPFLYSEWLCWVILLLVAKLTERNRLVIQSDVPNSADKLALAIAAVGVCWTLGDARWAVVRVPYSPSPFRWRDHTDMESYQPLTTPFCLLVTSFDLARSKLPTNSLDKQKYADTAIKVPIKGMVATVLVAAASAAFLFPSIPTTVDVGSGFAFVFCLLAVYFMLHQNKQEERSDDQPISVRIPPQSTVWRVAAMLTMMLLLPSNQTSKISTTLVGFIAVIKALQWVAAFELVHTASLGKINGALISR